VNARFLPAVFQKGVDPDGVASAQEIPYEIPNLRVEFNRRIIRCSFPPRIWSARSGMVWQRRGSLA
jgi:hypothetical protein